MNWKKFLLVMFMVVLLSFCVTAYSRKTFILHNTISTSGSSNYTGLFNSVTITPAPENITLPVDKYILFNVVNPASVSAVYEQPFINFLEGEGYNVSVVGDGDVRTAVLGNEDDIIALIVRAPAEAYSAHPETIADLDVNIVSMSRHTSRIALDMSTASSAESITGYRIKQTHHVSQDYDLEEEVIVYSESNTHNRISGVKAGNNIIVSTNTHETYGGIVIRSGDYDRVHWSAHRGNILTSDGWVLFNRTIQSLFVTSVSGNVLSVTGDSVFTGNVVADGSVTATSFVGDGAGLTGIDLSSRVPYTGANANLDMTGYNINAYQFIGGNGLRIKPFSVLYDENIFGGTAGQYPGGIFNYEFWHSFTFEIYPYKLIDGQIIIGMYSTVAPFQPDGFDDPYGIEVSWVMVNNCDGYIIIINDNVNGYNGDYYIQIDGNMNTMFNYDPMMAMWYSGFNNIYETNVLYSGFATEFVGVRTVPEFPLHVNGEVDGVSIWSEHDMSATNFIMRSHVYDSNKGKALDKIKSSNSYLDKNGNINHSAFGYSYRPIVFNKTVGYENKESIDSDGKPVIERVRIIQETIVEGVGLGEELALIKEAVYELKLENILLKAELCKTGERYSFC